MHFPKLTVVSFTNTYNQRLGVIDKIGRPRSVSPICLSRVWLLTELGDKKSFHHKNWDVPLPFSDYIYKLKNQRGHIDSLWLWVSRLSARQTELFFRQKILSADERLGAKLRVTENRFILFNSSTYVDIYINKSWLHLSLQYCARCVRRAWYVWKLDKSRIHNFSVTLSFTLTRSSDRF